MQGGFEFLKCLAVNVILRDMKLHKIVLELSVLLSEWSPGNDLSGYVEDWLDLL